MTPYRPWQLWAILALGAAAYIYFLRADNVNLRAALDARPAIHTEAEQKVQIVRVSGPVRVETKTVYVPGTTQIQYVDRIATSGPVTTSTQKDTAEVKDVRPACAPAPAAPWRYAGLVIAGPAPRAFRGGVTLWNRLDVGASYDWKYHAAGGEVALRF